MIKGTTIALGLILTVAASPTAWCMSMLQHGIKDPNINALQSEKLQATAGNGIAIHLDNQNNRLLFSDGKMIQFKNGQKFRFIWGNKVYVSGAAGWSSIDLNGRKENANDDLVDDPDDEAHGGTMFFEFDEPTRIESIKLVDIQSSAESIISTFDDQDDLISEIEVDGLGNNSVQTITVQDDGVARLEIFMKHSGGVARVDTCVPFEE